MLTCDGASSVYLVHLFMDCAPTSTSVLATKRVREDLCVIRAREAAWPIALYTLEGSTLMRRAFGESRAKTAHPWRAH